MAPSITPSSTHYALVIDAGSSGSRLQIYSWRDPDLERAEIIQEVNLARNGGLAETDKDRWWWDPKRGKGKGKQREDLALTEQRALRRLVRVGKGVEGDDWVKRAEPGISTVAPEDIPNYLAPLLSHALRHIPPSQHSSTPIYVLATAGMRLLPESTSSAILASTCELIRKDYPFIVDSPSAAGPCGDSIRIISGEEEGIWGWVAVNYLMDGFGHAPESATASDLPTISPANSYDTEVDSENSSSSSNLLPLAPLADPPPHSSTDSVTPVDVSHHSPTFGFLDMGGASTQLAFSPSPVELVKSGFPEDNLGKVSLRLLSGEEVEWPVFVASWLGFGTNRARERYAEALISRWSKEYETTGTSLDKPIVDPCLPANLEIPSDNPKKHPGFIGSGSFSQCLTELTPLLEHQAPCPTEHCLFAGQPTPHIDFEREDQRGFIGISEYWYTSEQVLGLGGVWDWGEWEKGMNEFCAKDWKDIEDEVEREKGWRGSSIGPSRLQMQCFKGAWISNVLHEGIGIPRLVDAGGNDTLTGGEIGDTNAEAERRAREKGLINGNGKGKTHFQSMDEVDQTAISWTLGKMVIEASKAVQPRSITAESAWRLKLSNLPLVGGPHNGAWEERLEQVGIQTIWAYGFIGFFVLACIFTSFRRRCLSSRPYSGIGKRPRKPSVGSYSLEDGFLSDGALSTSGSGLASLTNKPRFAIPGRLRLWSLRIGNTVKRSLPFGLGSSFGRHASFTRPSNLSMLPRHNSMPLPSNGAHSHGVSGSQPPSPRGPGSNFFVPAHGLGLGLSLGHGSSAGIGGGPGSLGVPITRPSSTSPELGSHPHTHTPSASPPRIKSQRGKPRNASYTYLASASASSHAYDRGSNTNLVGMGGGGVGGGGWNDPPSNMFGTGAGGNTHGIKGAGGGVGGYDTPSYSDRMGMSAGISGSGILTPSATFINPNASSMGLSRNSSRANLNEMGGMSGLSGMSIAMRSASRAGTPGFDETP